MNIVYEIYGYDCRGQDIKAVLQTKFGTVKERINLRVRVTPNFGRIVLYK